MRFQNKGYIKALRLDLTFKISLEVIQRKLQELEDRIDTVLPQVMIKWGLINGLGTILKSVSGNLDDNDGQIILSNIKTLKDVSHVLRNAQENQEKKIDWHVIIRFNNIKEHINSEHTKLQHFLDVAQITIFKELREDG